MENRDINNYGALSFSFEDPITDEIKTLYAIPMRLFFYQGNLTLSFEVWESKDAFESNMPSLGKWNKSFAFAPAQFADIRADYDSLFDPIEAAAFGFIDEISDEYELDSYDINLTNLQFKVQAIHKTTGKECSLKTRDLNEFETVKAQYPALVQAYFMFAWSYGKTNDSKLAKFN